jgi:integrase/recombinase XerD
LNKTKKVKRIGAQTGEKAVQEMYEDFQLNNKIKNLSDMTIRFYEQNLVHFSCYLDDESVTSVSSIDNHVLEQYILAMKQRGLKNTTINTYLRAARALLYFGMSQGFINNFEINLIKADKEQEEPYSEEDIKKLIKKPNLRTCGFVEHRKIPPTMIKTDSLEKCCELINSSSFLLAFHNS